MAIGFRSSSSADISGAGATTTITLPAGAVSTDVLVVIFGSRRTSLISPNVVTPPAGWTAISSAITDNNGTTEGTLHGFWALGNVASLVFSNSQTVLLNQGWSCAAFTGVLASSPIDATSTPNSGVTPVSTNSVTVVTGGAWHCIGVTDTDAQSVSATGFAAANNGTLPANASAGLLYNTTPKSVGPTGNVSIGINVSDPSDVLLGMPFALTPTADASVSLTGQSAAVARGNSAALTSVAPTGQPATVSQGGITQSSAIAPTGQFLQASQGEVLAGSDKDVSITGQSLSVAQGGATNSVSATATGQSATASSGSISAGVPPGSRRGGGLVITFIPMNR